MNNLERIPVRIEDICGVVAGVVLHPRARRNVNLRASGNCRLVELIDFGIVLSHESPMNRPRIRLTRANVSWSRWSAHITSPRHRPSFEGDHWRNTELGRLQSLAERDLPRIRGCRPRHN